MRWNCTLPISSAYIFLLVILLTFSKVVVGAPFNPVMPSVGGESIDSYPYGEVITVRSGETFTLDAKAHSYDVNGMEIESFFWWDLTPQTLPNGEGVFVMKDNSLAHQSFTAPQVSESIMHTDPGSPYVISLQVQNSEGQWSRSHLIYIQILAPEENDELVVSQHNNYALYQVSQEKFNSWSSADLFSDDGYQNVIDMTQKIYTQFEDDFDFIWVYLDRSDLPEGMPYGQYLTVSNSVTGLGKRSVFDNALSFGSEGRLKGVAVLYASLNDDNKVMKAMHLDATLHEMFHQYGNFIVPPPTSHWEWGVEGILAGAGSRMNAIEKYLAGYISDPTGEHAGLWDADSLAIWDQWRRDESFISRTPDHTLSQKDFRGLVVVLSTREGLTSSLDAELNFNIINFTRTDGQHKTYNSGSIESQNFWQATGGEGIGGNIKLNQLTQSFLQK
ncbi:hypothetical protein L4D09_20250 [Photobacterium makurazakiensis]|uniref:hypothetical protein n=1 Tax=Photobacterium makurazakiensis TaxID=2910234 RepID=UPI003D0DB7C0